MLHSFACISLLSSTGSLIWKNIYIYIYVHAESALHVVSLRCTSTHVKLTAHDCLSAACWSCTEAEVISAAADQLCCTGPASGALLAKDGLAPSSLTRRCPQVASPAAADVILLLSLSALNLCSSSACCHQWRSMSHPMLKHFHQKLHSICVKGDAGLIP